MSIASDLFALLAPLVGDRVFRDTFGQPDDLPQWPAIRFQIFDSQSEQTICGSDTEDTDDVSVQIDIVASTGLQADAIASQVIELMFTFPIPAVRTAKRADPYDAPTKTFRASLDYLLSQSSDGP